MEKPLFIPLKTKWFDAFVSGQKADELRAYGPRWNERTCRVGRAVTLSRGYGKQQRLGGHVASFEKRHGSLFAGEYARAIEETYGTLDLDIAVIGIGGLHRMLPHPPDTGKDE